MRIRKRAGLAAAALCLTLGPSFAAGEVHRIVMKSIAYEPRQVRAHVGDAVEWDNQDIVAHTATAPNKDWDISIMPGRSGRVVMKAPGTFDYICRYHPNMKGEVVVEP